MGDGTGSISGVTKCSVIDWVLLGLLLVIAVILTTLGIRIVKRE